MTLERKPVTSPQRDSWSTLQSLTTARIALGRAGASLPTAPLLDFGMAHARARDAIHAPLDVAALRSNLESLGFSAVSVTSQAASRDQYLMRPDLGRVLAPNTSLEPASEPNLLTIVVADGLSSLAPTRHAAPLLAALRERIHGFALDTIVIATQARVALADEIAQRRGAEAVLMLIGERPGLQASDSLGAYLTYRPRIGCTDADRNCVSNIRTGGLTYDEAAAKLAWLLREARILGATGIALKDASDAHAPLSSDSTR